MPMEEEYELIPMNPIRRIEKRMERIESAGTSTDVIKELIDITRANQHVVDNVVKINTEMISRISELSSTITGLSKKINEFLERAEVVHEDAPKENYADKERIERLEKRINSLILSMAKARGARPFQAATRPAPSMLA